MVSAFCPHCRSDVKVAASETVPLCSQCGKRFRVAGSSVENHASEWSLLDGIRSLLISMVVRGALSVPGALVAVYVAGFLPVGSGGRYRAALPILAGLVPGLVCGFMFGRGLEDRTGFTSALLYTAVIITALALGAGAWWLVHAVFPALPGQTTGIGAFAFACGFAMMGCQRVYDEC